ncbi:MAG: hypothetical protein WA691_02970 [Thermoplasmata archaeon]
MLRETGRFSWVVALALLTVMVFVGLVVAPAFTIAPASPAGAPGVHSGASGVHTAAVPAATLPTTVTVTLLTPAAPSSSVPFPVQFNTTIQNGNTNNSNTWVWLTATNLNHTATTFKVSFNGTVPGPVTNVTDQLTGYTYQTFTWGLTNVSNYTAVGCTNAWCGNLYAPGNIVALNVTVEENGVSFGGSNVTSTTTFDVTIVAHSTSVVITQAAVGLITATPYDAVVSTTVAQGNISNATTSVWFTLVDTLSSATLETWSLNDTVNQPLVAASYTNDSSTGTGYVSYTWNITVPMQIAGVNIPYQISDLTFWIQENGASWGGTSTSASSSIDTVFSSNVSTAAIHYTTSPPAVYSPIPFSLNFTIAVTSVPINVNDVAISVDVVDITQAVLCGPIPVPTVNLTTTYTVAINATTLAGPMANTACNFAADQIGFTATVVVTGAFAPWYSTNSSAAATVSTFLLGIEPTNASFLSPTSSYLGLGNITFVVSASGQFITGVTLQILSGTTIVLNSVLLGTTGVPGQYNPVQWDPAAGGTYTTALVLSNSYGAPTYINGTLTLVVSGVTKTTTTFYNQTAFGGLSPKEAGTILLVVGLIIGMLVALLVAASVQRSKTAPAAPQAWTGESKTTTTTTPEATNTCSVCGQSFPTAEELQAHSKAEHGMN